MITLDDSPREPLMVCTREEARKLYVERPEVRHRIWLQEEVALTMLFSPEQCAAAAKLKMEPGTIIDEAMAEAIRRGE